MQPAQASPEIVAAPEPARELDLSGEALTSMCNLPPLHPELFELCLMHNRICVIEGLEALTSLTKLNLRDNPGVQIDREALAVLREAAPARCTILADEAK